MSTANQAARVSVVLPSLDPTEKLTSAINGLLAVGFTDIILVNDGSKPENLHYFTQAAEHPEVTLLHHPVNRGKGAALKTAFAWFLENRPQSAGVVTVDGDGQHHPDDTLACAERMLSGGHAVLGVRDFNRPEVPSRSRFGNHVTSAVFKIFCGMTISDTQTGLRAIPRRDLAALTAVAGDRFEYETNMLLAFKEQGIPFDEVKIQTIYIEENESSHFHVFRDSWRIYKLIFAHFFTYTLSSVICALTDTGLFALLSALLPLSGTALTAAATAGARICSSLLNFFLNQRMVFHSSGPIRRALFRYYALAIPQLLAQILLTEGLLRLLGIGDSQTLLRTLLYTMVMTALFICSYVIQQRWVFAADRQNRED